METNVIYNEDCLETLKRLEDESIDLIVTSPPYNKGAYASATTPHVKGETWGKMKGRRIAYDIYEDCMPPEEYEEWQKTLIRECLRVLKPTGSFFYNHKDILYNGSIVPPKWVYEFPIHQQIVWDRANTPAIDTHYFFPITEYIYWFVKDAKKMIFDRDKSGFKTNIFKVNATLERNSHPAPFPMKLINSLIASCTKPEAVIYDPFMGSGTTALSTINVGEGRSYIGSEISPAYCEMAEKRIREATSQLRLF